MNRDAAGLFDLEDLRDARELLLGERPLFVRATLWLSLGFLSAALVWACLTRVDIVVTAPGVVRPSGDVVQVQSPRTGVVAEVLAGIKEGAAVASGQVLLRLDARPLELERRNAVARIEARRAAKRELRKARESELAGAELELESEKTRHAVAVVQARARLATSATRKDTASARAGDQEKKVRHLGRLVDAGFARTLELDEERRVLASLRGAADLAGKELDEARVAAEPDRTALKLAEGRVALRRRAIAELDAPPPGTPERARDGVPQLDAEISALERELEAIELRIQRSELRAIVAGTVTNLVFTHEGRVVPEGAVVAEISPSASALVLEALVRNGDRGRPLVGKTARVRFRAFRHQDYGTVEGQVASVSPDTRATADGAGRPSEPSYRAVIELPASSTLRDRRGERGRIELGMTAEADIVIERRRLVLCIATELRGVFGP